MDKFSKLRPKTDTEKKDKELFSKGALKIRLLADDE